MTTMKPMIALLRHGQTEWNKTARLMSHTDLGLSEEGYLQCHRIAITNADVQIDNIFASPSLRAIQSAEIILKHCQIKSPIRTDPRLKEVDFGVFEGRTGVEVLIANDSAEYLRWQQGEDVPSSIAEPLREASIRIADFINEISKIPGTHLVVSHGYLLRVFLATAVLGMPLSCVRALRLDNARFATIEFESGAPRLTSFNVSDLRGVQDDSPTS